MAPDSSTLAWKIPWTEEPGRLQSTGSLRVRHDLATSLSLFTFMHWRRKWQPTPVFLPGESQGQGSLVGCRLCGRTELDTSEVTQHSITQHNTAAFVIILIYLPLWPPVNPPIWQIFQLRGINSIRTFAYNIKKGPVVESSKISFIPLERSIYWIHFIMFSSSQLERSKLTH